jgi:predicted PurR-regulated permease PerM
VESRPPAWRMDHPIIITFLILALVTFLSFGAAFLKPLALAILLSFALAPLARRMERYLPRALAVVLTVVFSLGLLVLVGMVVWNQLGSLTANIDRYEANIQGQIGRHLRGHSATPLDKLSKLGERVSEQLDEAEEAAVARQDIPKVEIIRHNTLTEQLTDAVGPFVEVAGTGAFVLILVIFMLMHREDLRDRVVQLFGSQNVSRTTTLMDEAGGRISRYLGMLSIVNASFGLVVGLGLWAIGVEYAVLWGFLAGALRFVPYVGPSLAFLMPVIFSFASSTSLTQPLMVMGLFAILETVANVAIEPVVYGKTTGISALGLLVAAMFWTWLWGALGLLLSTPLTVCLAVLGRSIPALGAFGTLLGETAELSPDVRYYQRILANDADGSIEVAEGLASEKPPIEVYDQVFLPALSLGERDESRGMIDEAQRSRLWRITWDIVEELASSDEGAAGISSAGQPPRKVIGVAASDSADALALRMLGRLLAPSQVELRTVLTDGTPLELAERIVEQAPDAVLISHVIPAGLAHARYLVRRLHARLPGVPIIVGLWGNPEEAQAAVPKFLDAGATKVVPTLAAAREALTAPAATEPRSPAALVGAAS